MDGRCNEENLIYCAPVKTYHESKQYIGQTAGKFIVRYRNHLSSFKLEKYRKNTELSKYIWNRKEEGYNCTIEWEIKSHFQSYIPGSINCKLCIGEAMNIMYLYDSYNLINSKDEVIHNCLHKRKWKLEYYGIT